VEEIQGDIMKQGKRNAIARRLYAREDNEKIPSWRSDLNRILHDFNVRSIISSVRLQLTMHSQTVNVSQIHHDMKGQDGNGDKHLLVSDTRTLAATE
jgi:hypothetical protein